MSKLQIKAIAYQFVCFAILFFIFRYLIISYFGLSEIWGALSAFVLGTVLSPKFLAMRTKEGEKLFMKWIFLKGTREIS